MAPPEHCWPVRPTLRNELDTFSVHFYIFFGPSVALPPERPAVFALRLLPVLDSGGVLSLELQLNAVCPGRVASMLGSLKGRSQEGRAFVSLRRLSGGFHAFLKSPHSSGQQVFWRLTVL